ncbi:hypothetical protein, partial [Halorubrum alkaliphilum]|uniref:hypothetical protein n=1 Tax=Halorubrum alkaliphilum TaxID=261290 RepID=UPI001AE2D992
HTKNFVESSAIMRLSHGLTLCRLSRPRGKHVQLNEAVGVANEAGKVEGGCGARWGFGGVHR